MIFKRVPRRDRYAAARPWVHQHNALVYLAEAFRHHMGQFVWCYGHLKVSFNSMGFVLRLFTVHGDSFHHLRRAFGGFPVRYDVVVQGVDVVLLLEANVIKASSTSFAQWQNYARAFCASRYEICTECPDCEGTYPECLGRKIALCIAHWDSSPSSAKHDFLWHLSVRLHRKVSKTSTSIGIRRG